MRSHTEIVEQAGADAALAVQLNVKVHQPRDWRLRNSIPPEFWLTFKEAGFATLDEQAAAAKAKKQALYPGERIAS